MEAVRKNWTQYWTEDELEGRKFWELRDALPPGLDTRLFPTVVVIEWRYAEGGLPDAATMHALHAFETRLAPLEDASDNSLAVHIIRGRGTSELGYYVRDYDRFMVQLNDVLACGPRVPIEIEFFEDPDWRYRESIVGNFAE
jgi:hypothetical protein